MQGAARKLGHDLTDAAMLLLSDRFDGDQHIIIDRQCSAHAAPPDALIITHQIACLAPDLKRASWRGRCIGLP